MASPSRSAGSADRARRRRARALLRRKELRLTRHRLGVVGGDVREATLAVDRAERAREAHSVQLHGAPGKVASHRVSPHILQLNVAMKSQLEGVCIKDVMK